MIKSSSDAPSAPMLSVVNRLAMTPLQQARSNTCDKGGTNVREWHAKLSSTQRRGAWAVAAGAVRFRAAAHVPRGAASSVQAVPATYKRGLLDSTLCRWQDTRRDTKAGLSTMRWQDSERSIDSRAHAPLCIKVR